MIQNWKQAFQESKWAEKLGDSFGGLLFIDDLRELKSFLDTVHIRECLLRPYFEIKKYPLVDTRALLPSFEPDPYEYHNLPGFSMVVLDRILHSFSEIFQYDIIYPVTDLLEVAQGTCCPLESNILSGNTLTMLSRMPRALHERYRREFQRTDITVPEMYSNLLPYLLDMDRAHVMSKNSYGHFKLSGIFASLPSDFDGELKRFGIRIGKFQPGDNEMYERNRAFVMQFLMELYGFAVVSERRTSAALFSRRLHKIGERFLIRALGQSDRTLTTIWNPGLSTRYPVVEKVALVKVEKEQKDLIEALRQQNAFVDEQQRVLILRIHYLQHSYDPDNVRQDRALSVSSQEVIHPLTGEALQGFNVIRDSSNLILRLNDIVRGEYSGRILYKRTELIENTDSEEKRLKFLYSWLTKNQRRFIGYSDEFFSHTRKILDHYLEDLQQSEAWDDLDDLIEEVDNKYNYIQQARKIRNLEDIRSRYYKGEKLNYDRMLAEAIALMQDFKFELSIYFEDLVTTAIHNVEAMLNDRYLRKTYIEKPESKLTRAGLEVRRKYGRLVTLLDEFKAIQKRHLPQAVAVIA